MTKEPLTRRPITVYLNDDELAKIYAIGRARYGDTFIQKGKLLRELIQELITKNGQ